MRTVVALTAFAGIAILQAQDEWKAPARASKKKNPIAFNEKSIALGKKFYIRECLSCHGDTGKGDGPQAKDLEKKPTDLSTADQWDESDGALYWKITEGRKPMATYEKLLSEEERWHVVNFLRTLTPAAKTPELATPEEPRKALSDVFASYNEIREALASDKADVAHTAAAKVASSVEQAVAIKGADESEWIRTLKELQTLSASLSAAEQIEDIRKQFAALSEALVAAIKKFGHAEDRPLRLVRCPMAFDGKGASWLQHGKEIANPYFGSKMKKCGRTESLLAPTTTGGVK